MTIDEALREVLLTCDYEAYVIVRTYIEDLEKEVEFLNVEIEAISSAPKKRRRKQEDDWE